MKYFLIFLVFLIAPMAHASHLCASDVFSYSGGSGLGTDALWEAKSFTVSAQCLVTDIEVPFVPTGSPAVPTATLRSDLGGQPSGTVLETGSFSWTSNIGTVTFGGTTDLEPGNLYWLVFYTPEDDSNYYRWRSAGSGGVFQADYGTPTWINWSPYSVGLTAVNGNGGGGGGGTTTINASSTLIMANTGGVILIWYWLEVMATIMFMLIIGVLIYQGTRFIAGIMKPRV